MVKEFGVEKLKKWAGLITSGSDSWTDGDALDYFRSVAGWVDDKGCGKKELPEVKINPRSQADLEDNL